VHIVTNSKDIDKKYKNSFDPLFTFLLCQNTILPPTTNEVFQVKVIYVGADHREGVSSKTGQPYSISNVYYAIPVTPKTTDSFTYKACGMKIVELRLDPSALRQFAQVPAFQEVDLKVEPMADNPSRNICVGVQ
jgi:hypothetical protein